MSTTGGHAAACQPGAVELASAAETLAGLTTAALEGGLDSPTALALLTAVRCLAAELERSERRGADLGWTTHLLLTGSDGLFTNWTKAVRRAKMLGWSSAGLRSTAASRSFSGF
jgi:hypothetical protein